MQDIFYLENYIWNVMVDAYTCGKLLLEGGGRGQDINLVGVLA